MGNLAATAFAIRAHLALLVEHPRTAKAFNGALMKRGIQFLLIGIAVFYVTVGCATFVLNKLPGFELGNDAGGSEAEITIEDASRAASKEEQGELLVKAAFQIDPLNSHQYEQLTEAILFMNCRSEYTKALNNYLKKPGVVVSSQKKLFLKQFAAESPKK